MAAKYGILGQASPNGGVLTNVYVGPAGRAMTVKVIVCNRAGVDLFRIAVSPEGAPIESKHYLSYDKPIQANDSLSSTAISVGPGDILRVQSTNGGLSFTVTGIEEDN